MTKAAGTERVQRQVAPGVVERHQRGCNYARGRRRCTCRPVFRAKVAMVVEGRLRTATRSFPTLDEASAWRERARADLAVAGALSAPSGRARIPTLGAAARDFLKRAAASKALTRSRRPYAATTLASYENVLRRHVLPHRHELLGVPLEALPADALDARAIQALVNAVTTGASPSLARVADAALSAVLRDLYERSVIDALPARPVLPPPPAPRDERLSLAEADALIAAAVVDDERMRRSLMGPFVALLVNGGLRVSEAIDLTWGENGIDLDASPPRVAVRRTGTKTDAGVRTIGLDAMTASALQRHRVATGGPPDGALVFSHDGSRLTRSGRLRSGLKRVAKAASVPGGFHLLRHTHGSLLADAGQGGHEIAARLGHRDPAFTARTYVHADPGRLGDAPAALEALRNRERTAGG
ncbi:MAG: tyrosine-type recombinase/integrase [Dehalococcoidia bacterium]